MKTSTIAEFGLINWAILTPGGEFCRVATDRGVFAAEPGGKNHYFLCPDGEGDEANRYTVSGHFCGPGGQVARGRHAYRFYVRPGLSLELFAQSIDPEGRARELKFGRDGAYEFKRPERVAVKQRRADWRRVLAEGGLRLTRRAPRIPTGMSFDEHDEDSQGSLLFNRITGFWQTRPDGDADLDEGFYFSRHGVWAGAASDEGCPDWELRLFFAALPPWQRRALANKLAKHQLGCRPAGRHWDGEFGIDVDDLPRAMVRRYFPGVRTIDPMRGFEPDKLSDEARDVLSEACLYLSTLFAGRTRRQDTEVLKQLQLTECGLARFARPNDTVRGWCVVDDGGTLSIGGLNHGTRLLKLLKMPRHAEVKRAVLQKRWAKLMAAGKVRWEASEIFTLAADFGIAPYPSRQWVVEALRERRAERRKDAEERRVFAEQAREEAQRRERMLASRRDDDRFSVVPKEGSPEHFELHVERDGATVESYLVCREGTRLFCSRTGCTPSGTYTREELKARIAAVMQRPDHEAWVESHNFRGLFRELGVNAAA